MHSFFDSSRVIVVVENDGKLLIRSGWMSLNRARILCIEEPEEGESGKEMGQQETNSIRTGVEIAFVDDEYGQVEEDSDRRSRSGGAKKEVKLARPTFTPKT